MYYHNAGGLKSRLQDFRRGVECSLYDAVIITESWLDDGVLSGETFVRGYNTFRLDRSLENSGKKKGRRCNDTGKGVYSVKCH